MREQKVIDIINENLAQRNQKVLESCYNIEVIKSADEVIRSNKDCVTIIHVQGNVDVEIENTNIKLTTNNILFVKHGEVYVKKIDSNMKSIYVLHIMPELLNDYLKTEMSDCPIIYDFLRLEPSHMEYLLFDITRQNNIRLYLELVYLEASYSFKQKERSKYEKNMRCALILLLTKLHEGHHESLIISESTMMEDYDIGRILKYMSDNYSKVTLSTMAEVFNFHPAYFSARFKKLAGCSFSEKLLLIRLEQARRLLATTDMSIQKVVETVGFTEKSYFYKVFRKNYSMTPLEYRKKNQVD